MASGLTKTASEKLDIAEQLLTSFLSQARQVVTALESAGVQLASERLNIALATNQIKMEREALEREKEHVDLRSGEPTDEITLNVGGTKYTTTRHTLCAIPNTALSAWFSGRYNLITDENGDAFIDRDPHLFSHILDYCRQYPLLQKGISTWNFEDHLVPQLRQEFDYFCIPWPFESESMVNQYLDGLQSMTLAGHTDAVLGVDVKGNIVASCSMDETVRLWDLDTGKCLHILRHPVGVVAVSVCQKGSIVVTGDTDGMVRVWTTADGKVISELSTNAEGFPTGSVAFSDSFLMVEVATTLDNGGYFYGQPCKLVCYDAHNQKSESPVWTHMGTTITRLLVSDGFVHAVVGRVIHKLNITNGVCVNKFVGHNSTIQDVSFSDNEVLVSVSMGIGITEGTEVFLWTKDGIPTHIVQGNEFEFLGSVLATHKWLVTPVVCHLSTAKTGLWLQDWDSAVCIKLNTHVGHIYDVARSGNIFISASEDTFVKIAKPNFKSKRLMLSSADTNA